MIKETGVVVDIQGNNLWVETIRRSTCGSCSARQGCGQHLLSRFIGGNSRIPVLPGEVTADIKVGDEVVIGIAGDVLVRGALSVYLLPLLGLAAGVVIGHVWLQTEWAAVVFGFAGLGLVALTVRMKSWQLRNDPRVCPVLLGRL